jgi:chromosomal replication initiator protein
MDRDLLDAMAFAIPDGLQLAPPTLAEITAIVGEYYRLPRVRGHDKAAALARQVVCHLAREMTGKTLGEISHHLNWDDHTTVSWSDKRIGERLKTDELLRDDIDILKLRITEMAIERFGGVPCH